VHSISLRLFSIERSLFLRRKHANSVIPSITYRLWAVLSSHILYRIPRSRIGVLPWITFRACLHSSHGGLRWSCVGKW
jgi:hypothetical protein